MRIWFPLATLLSAGWLLLVSVLVSRGGSAGAQVTDAAGLLRQSQEAMLELDSFQLEYVSPSEGLGITYRVLWQRPNSVHVLYPNLVAHYGTGQEPAITDQGFVEGIVIGERIYIRRCAAEGEDCQPWEENTKQLIYMPGSYPGQLDPLWTIELLGLVSSPQIVGQDDVEGVASTRIRGRTNLVQATVQSMRRAEETRGPLDWGEECAATPTEPGGRTQEECYQTTLDEYIAMIEESAAEEGWSGPVPVEVWVGEDDRRVRRFDLLQYAPGEVVAMSFTYFQFNEVDIQPPQ